MVQKGRAEFQRLCSTQGTATATIDASSPTALLLCVNNKRMRSRMGSLRLKVIKGHFWVSTSDAEDS